MPKLRVIIKPPPEPQGDAEQQTEALRDYLLQMSEELAYVLTHLEADNINDSTFERIQSMIPRPYTGLPVMDGDASSGQSEQWARGDHRHPKDTSKADVTALATETAAREAHEADTGNPHEVTKAQVGLGNVANERQYSAQNPPPIPTPVQVGAIPVTEKGSAGGVAELDSNGMVPSAQLPSYVDDVLNYPTLADFPAIGEDGKIYVAKDTNKQYRWSGIDYVQISESLALGETSSTAYRGDRGKIAYDHSQTTGNPHGTTAAEVGARPDDWMPSAADVGARPDTWVPTKADVGLGNVENERQYSAQNPPPYPVTSVNGSTGAVSLAAADVGARPDNWVPDAEDVPYDNTQSGLMATDMQAAIDELAQGGGGGGTAAAAVSYDNTGSGLAATNVQDAIDEVYGDIPTQPSDIGAQPTITANGILKGDGAGGVSAAVAGTDYGTYSKPSGGIPASDLASGVIPTVPSAYTSNPAMDGTASPGSSGAWAKGDHVHPSDTSRVPVYGLGKNLLDNWYFLNPVNQRSAMTGRSGYCIDRWGVTYGSGGASWSLTSSGLTFQPVKTSSYGALRQIIGNEILSALTGKSISVYVLTSDGDMIGGTATHSSNVSIYDANYNGHRVHIRFSGGELRIDSYASALTVCAVKFELGTEQTLCHNEGTAEAPVWVLNEVPDYEYELYRCMTSTADPSDTYANKSLATGQEIAYVENGTTATKTNGYAAGEYFVWHGLLYRAKTAIGNGDTFTENTNCEQVTEGGMNSLRSVTVNALTIEATSYITSINQCYSYTVGRTAYVFISCRIEATPTTIINLLKGIPRPYNDTTLLFIASASSTVLMGLCVSVENGVAYISKANNNATTAGWYTGTISYPIA